MEIIKRVRRDGITVTLFYPVHRGKDGRDYLSYRLHDRGRLVFSGEDFSPSPLSSWYSNRCIGALVGFLSLRRGDTDDEYFAGYSLEQLAWADSNADMMSLWAEELEEVP